MGIRCLIFPSQWLSSYRAVLGRDTPAGGRWLQGCLGGNLPSTPTWSWPPGAHACTWEVGPTGSPSFSVLSPCSYLVTAGKALEGASAQAACLSDSTQPGLLLTTEGREVPRRMNLRPWELFCVKEATSWRRKGKLRQSHTPDLSKGTGVVCHSPQ